MTLNLTQPREFQPLLEQFKDEPIRTQAMWQYVFVRWLIDEKKAHVLRSDLFGDGRIHLVVRTNAGETFEVDRPEMPYDVEDQLTEQLPTILATMSGETDTPLV